MAIAPSLISHGNLFDPFLFGTFWDPSEAFPLWDFTPTSLFVRDLTAVANTHLDWFETLDAHIIQADLPGLRKDDIEVIVEDGRVLQISGQRKRDSGENVERSRWRFAERAHAGYLRRLTLPKNAIATELKAHVEDGVLTITIPKVQEKEPPSQIEIVEITGDS